MMNDDRELLLLMEVDALALAVRKFCENFEALQIPGVSDRV